MPMRSLNYKQTKWVRLSKTGPNPEKDAIMAKGNKVKSNKEIKKPKQVKPKAAAATGARPGSEPLVFGNKKVK